MVTADDIARWRRRRVRSADAGASSRQTSVVAKAAVPIDLDESTLKRLVRHDKGKTGCEVDAAVHVVRFRSTLLLHLADPA